jgi:transposase InsO family protein
MRPVPQEEIVVDHLRRRITGMPITEGPPRRGVAGQLPRRDNEQVVRRHAVEVAESLVERGWSRSAAADLLDVSIRTLNHWRRSFVTNSLSAVPLGRPTQVASVDQRNTVLRHIAEHGPRVGVPRLWNEFPNHARRELEDLLRRYRHVWRQKHPEQLRQLHWQTPGSVWAIDFHGPRLPIDGACPYLLAVRDLASGYVPLWLPTRDATAAAVMGALEPLFVCQGAPLVLKSDNGSAFIAGPVRKLCENFGVKILFSPPRRPRYNGAIEATIGSLKTRTERQAAALGRPGLWTSADLAAARAEANTMPIRQRWAGRQRTKTKQRDQFLDHAQRRFEQLALAQGTPKDDAQYRAMDRQAISQALVELGYLSITRGRLRLPIF